MKRATQWMLMIVATVLLFFLQSTSAQGPGIVRSGGIFPWFGPDPRPQGPVPMLMGSETYATCYFNDTYSPVKGRVDMKQDIASPGPPVIQVRIQVMGLAQTLMSDIEHALHVHQWGDMTRNCYNAGPHFDSDTFSFHGPPNAFNRNNRHDGDFGNHRQTNAGIIDTKFNVQNMALAGDAGIVGRSVVLHAGRDDLGRGNNPVSLETGNSGPPIACCVLGLSDTTNWENPLFTSGGSRFNPGMLG